MADFDYEKYGCHFERPADVKPTSAKAMTTMTIFQMVSVACLIRCRMT